MNLGGGAAHTAPAANVSAVGGGQAAPAEITLWPPTCIPGGGGPVGTGDFVITSRDTTVRVAVPKLRVFRPEKPNGAAMIVAAGGGYHWLANEKEALPAAEWLTKRGVTAFVLHYRLTFRPDKVCNDKPSERWGAWPLAPLQDAQRAVRMVKAHAAAYGIDPLRIGLLGFSAGGHLMGLCANRAHFQSYAPVDDIDRRFGTEVAVQALIYPVITMQQPHDETKSKAALIGDAPTPMQRTEWSVETYAHEKSPPAFLVQAADDQTANPEVRGPMICNTAAYIAYAACTSGADAAQHSAILERALSAKGVRVKRHLLPSGGHGFAMGGQHADTREWPKWLTTWLRARGFMPDRE